MNLHLSSFSASPLSCFPFLLLLREFEVGDRFACCQDHRIVLFVFLSSSNDNALPWLHTERVRFHIERRGADGPRLVWTKQLSLVPTELTAPSH